MSNGIPEPFEERSRRPLRPLPLVAGAYVVLWLSGVIASFFVNVPLVCRGDAWFLVGSMLLVAGALGVLWSSRAAVLGLPMQGRGGASEDQVGTSLTRAPPQWFAIGCAILGLAVVAGMLILLVRLLTGQG